MKGRAAAYLFNQAEEVMDEKDAMRLFNIVPSPDEVVAHERTKFLDVQLRALLQMRFPATMATYNILVALLNERPMQDMLFAAFLIIEETMRRTNMPALDRELHYKIAAELAHDLIQKINQPPAAPPDDKEGAGPEPPPAPVQGSSEKPE